MTARHERAPGRGAEGRGDQDGTGSSPTLPPTRDTTGDTTPREPAEYSRPRAAKRRGAPRGPRAATLARREALVELIEAVGPPVTARQVYYLAAGRGLIPKNDREYRKVLRDLGDMREAGTLPWAMIADNTRWVRQAQTWNGPAEAVEDMQRAYRRDYWRDQPVRVEVWVESDSIASFVSGITDGWGVPLYVCRGQASKSYVYEAAQTAEKVGKPVRILYIGDFDPTGVQIDLSLQERLERYGTGIDLALRRVSVTPAQIIAERLDGGPVKVRDSNLSRFRDLCRINGVPVAAVETEARDPNRLRADLEQAIRDQILNPQAWNAIRAFEDQERDVLDRIDVGGLR